MRVLAVAAAVHPEKGSEPGLGWGWLSSLAEHNDIWAIIGEREGCREAIESRLADDAVLRERLRVYFIPRPDGPGVEEWIPLLYYRSYRRWHARAFTYASQLCDQVRFDLAHQLNMTGYREPGFLWKLRLPFVWGPTGGTTNVPLRFWRVLGWRETAYHLARRAVNEWQLRFHPRVRRALQRADGFVTSTNETRETFQRVWKKDSIVIADNGPPHGVSLRGGCSAGGSGPLRLLWSGVHVSRKALPLLLLAIGRLPAGAVRLDILGDGPMSGRWRDLARRLGVMRHCEWHGWVPRARALELTAAADVAVLTSLHESVPAVAFEALSLGRPLVCLDCCGQADLVTAECGIKIAPSDVDHVVVELASALERLVRDRGLVARMGEAARLRVRSFSWAVKAQQMQAVYRSAVAAYAARVGRMS